MKYIIEDKRKDKTQSPFIYIDIVMSKKCDNYNGTIPYITKFRDNITVYADKKTYGFKIIIFNEKEVK